MRVAYREREVPVEQNETFGNKMRKAGWHNVYDEKPKEPGIYEVYRRNDTRGKAKYIGNGVWEDTSGWSFCWWRELKGSETSGK